MIYIKSLFIFSILFLLNFFVFAWQQFIDSIISWHKVKIIKVVLDGNHKVITSIAEEWKDLFYFLNKEKGISAINGVYFCPKDYSNCWWKDYTNAPRFYKWKNYSKYWNDFGVNGVFSFDKSWKPFLVMNHVWGDVPNDLENISYNADKIKNIYYWLGNFPVLLLKWKSIVNYYSDILSDKIKSKWIKNFICYTRDRKIIYMWFVYDIDIYTLSYFIKEKLGCYEAINLDSGWSLWMIYNNKLIKKNLRPVMDAFVVVETMDASKRQYIISKYWKVISKIVYKIKKKVKWDNNRLKYIKQKIRYIQGKYKNNFKIYVILEEIYNRL